MGKTKDVKSYSIDFGQDNINQLAMSNMVADRKCYPCRQDYTAESIMNSDPQEHMSKIIEHCSKMEDYIQQDTPLKEAIFRELLSRGNNTITTTELSENLSHRWTMSAYPRALSPTLFEKILARSGNYGISVYIPPKRRKSSKGRSVETKKTDTHH